MDGPEDLHYFQDEEVELHALPKNTKAKDFYGASLPFIGYTFEGETHHLANPEISVSDNIPHDEFNNLKKAYDEECDLYQKSQMTIAQIEKTNIDLSAENKRLQLALDIDANERTSLQNQIKSLMIIKSEQKEKLNILETQINQLEPLSSENVKLQSANDANIEKIAELAKDLEMRKTTATQMDVLKHQLSSETREHNMAKDKMLALENAFTKEKVHHVQTQQSLKNAIEAQNKLELQLTQIQNAFYTQSEEFKLQKQTDSELNIQKNTLEEQVAKVSAQLMALKSENNILKEKISTISPASEKNEDQIHILEQQILELTTAKCQLISSVDFLQRQNNTLKTEIEKMSSNMLEEIKKTKSLTEIMLRKDTEIIEITSKLTDLQNQKISLDRQISFANNKISSLKECLHKENELVKDYEAKTINRNGSIAQLQDLNLALNELLDEVKIQNSKLIDEKSCLEEQIKAEKISSQNKDLVISEQVLLVESLQAENKSQLDRIGMIKTQYEQFVSDSQAIFIKSKHDYAELKRQFANEQERRISLENIKATMTRLVIDLESASKKESAERQRLDLLLDAANHKIRVLQSKLSDQSSYSSDLTLDSAGSITSHRIPRKSRLSFKQLFKSSGSLMNVSKSVARVGSVDSVINHERSQSIDTCGKSQMSLGE